MIFQKILQKVSNFQERKNYLSLINKLLFRFFTGIRFITYFLDYLIIGFFKKRVLLLNYTGLEKHIGCRATSECLIKMIRNKKIGRILPFPIRYSKPKKEILDNINNIQQCFKEYLKKNVITLLMISMADYVVINGEGTIYEYKNWSEGTRPLELLLQAYISKKIYQKRVFLVNCSIDYIKHDPNNEFLNYVKSICSELDYVGARDPLTFRLLKENSVPRLVQSADAIFSSSRNKDCYNKKVLHEIGVDEGYIGIFLTAKTENLPSKKVLKLLYLLKENFKKEVVFFPYSNYELCIAEDIRKEGFKTINLLCSSGKFIEILSFASCILSGRFHYCIFSTIAGTPFIPFRSSTNKNEALTKQLEYPIGVLNYSESSKTEILNTVRYVLHNRETLKKILLKQLPKQKKLAEKNIPVK